MFEVIATAALLRKKYRTSTCGYVTVLMVLSPKSSHPHSLTNTDFVNLFAKERHVIYNYHGYPLQLKGLLFGHTNIGRATIEGYSEEGG